VPGLIGLLDTTVSFEWTVTLPFLLDILAKRNCVRNTERERERERVMGNGGERAGLLLYVAVGIIMREAGVR